MRVVFEDNDGWVDEKKALLHDNRWYVYVNENENIIKGGYLLEVICSDKKKVILEVVKDHAAEEGNDHYNKSLLGLDVNLLDEYEEEVGREGLIEYADLLMLMKVWPGDFNNQSEMINIKVDEDNYKAAGIMNGWY